MKQGGSSKEHAWRKHAGGKHGGGSIQEEAWRKHGGASMEEEAWRRKQGGGSMEEEQEEEAWRIHPGASGRLGGATGGTMGAQGHPGAEMCQNHCFTAKELATEHFVLTRREQVSQSVVKVNTFAQPSGWH